MSRKKILLFNFVDDCKIRVSNQRAAHVQSLECVKRIQNNHHYHLYYGLAFRKEDEDEDFVFVNGANGDKEPVVFLLGWLGAQDRHLAKYCTIYNQRRSVFLPNHCLVHLKEARSFTYYCHMVIFLHILFFLF